MQDKSGHLVKRAVLGPTSQHTVLFCRMWSLRVPSGTAILLCLYITNPFSFLFQINNVSYGKIHERLLGFISHFSYKENEAEKGLVTFSGSHPTLESRSFCSPKYTLVPDKHNCTYPPNNSSCRYYFEFDFCILRWLQFCSQPTGNSLGFFWIFFFLAQQWSKTKNPDT